MDFFLNIYRKNKVLIKQYVIYFGIGILGAVVDLSIFSLLLNIFTLNYIFAFLLGKVSGMVNNFFFNAKFNFKTTDNYLKRLSSFIFVGSIGIAVGTGLMYLAVDILSLNELFSNIVITFLVATIQFFINRAVSFKKAN